MLSHKIIIDKFQQYDFILSMFPGHASIKLEINERKRPRISSKFKQNFKESTSQKYIMWVFKYISNWLIMKRWHINICEF